MLTETEGLEFFPMSVDFFEDDKLELIDSEFGHKGPYLAVRLICKMYKFKGYYYNWGKDECLLLTRRLGAEFNSNLVEEIIQALLRRDFFSKEMFDKYKLLTSRGMQKRFFEAVRRRQRVNVRRELILIDLKEYPNVRFIDEDEAQQDEKTEDVPTQNAEPAPTADLLQRSLVAYFFFERNFLQPNIQAQKFNNYNLANNPDWMNLPAKQRLAAAGLWNQQDDDGKTIRKTRFQPSFLSAWKGIYEYANQVKADDAVIDGILADCIEFKADQVYDPNGPERKEYNLLTCPKCVHVFMIAHKDNTAPIMRPALNGKIMKFYAL